MPDNDSIRMEPKSQLEILVDECMDDLKDQVEDNGGEIKQLVVICYAEGIGEQDTVTAGHGFADAQGVFIFMMGEMAAIGRQLGLDMHVGLMPKPGGDN